MSQFFSSGAQSFGVLASASVLSMFNLTAYKNNLKVKQQLHFLIYQLAGILMNDKILYLQSYMEMLTFNIVYFGRIINL